MVLIFIFTSVSICSLLISLNILLALTYCHLLIKLLKECLIKTLKSHLYPQ